MVGVLVANLAPSPVLGWEKTRELIHGSSRVLEKGETLVGVLSPLAYGLHERVTIFTHPALFLLLTPSIWGRVLVLDDDSGFSLEGGYQQSIGNVATGNGDEGNAQDFFEFGPGYIQFGAVYSLAFADRWQVNLGGGYVAEFNQRGKEDQLKGLYWRAGLHWLADERHVVMADIRGKIFLGTGPDLPSGTVIGARQFGRVRIGIGAAFGRFFIADLIEEDLYVYPWVDLWWRF